MEKGLRIVQVGTRDIGGGAEKFALDLHCLFNEMGHRSTLIVGTRRGDADGVLEINNSSSGALSAALRWACEKLLRWRGLSFPGSFRIPEGAPGPWDVLFLHNLHGDYFDLRALERLSRLAPMVLRLHDCWMLTGGCPQPLDCDRNSRGCWYCPRMQPQSRLRALKTWFNWRRKKKLANRLRPMLSVPSQWVIDMMPGTPVEGLPARIDPYGIDTQLFTPGDRARARERLGLSPDESIVLFSANGGLANPFKDGETLLKAVSLAREESGAGRFRLVVLGVRPGAPGPEGLPDYVTQREYTSGEAKLADYYRAADVFAHATKADTCGMVMLEAMACGTPVVASDIAGVPDYIEGDRTGILVRPADPQAMSKALVEVLRGEELRGDLVANALAAVREKYDIRVAARRYLDLFTELASRQRDREEGGA